MFGKTIIDVHYTWVGPTHDEDHDVEGPKSLLAKLKDTDTHKYHCYFWCLDRYVDAFTKKLKKLGLSITVRGMETFLGRCGWTSFRYYYWYGSKEDDMVARVGEVLKVLPTKATVFWDKKAVSTRDIVNAKNIWSFFVLYTWGGYHFDTGILADPKGKLTLQPYKVFKAPRAPKDDQLSFVHHKIKSKHFALQCSSIVIEGNQFFGVEDPYTGMIFIPHYDVWALYSPRYDARAYIALTWYYRAWKYLRDQNLKDELYRPAFRAAIMNALYTALSHNDKGLCQKGVDEDSGWKWDDKDGTTVPELGILKVFHGSHRKGVIDEKKDVVVKIKNDEVDEKLD